MPFSKTSSQGIETQHGPQNLRMMAASCLISGPLESLCVVSVSGAATSDREDSNCKNLKERELGSRGKEA